MLATIPNTLLGYVRVVGEYLYISSHTNNVLYRVHKQTGAWKIIAGNGVGIDSDGPLLQANFLGIWDLAVSRDGKALYVSAYRATIQTASPVIRRIHLD